MKKLLFVRFLVRSLSGKLSIFGLITMTVISMFAVINFIPLAKASPGSHRVTAIFYMVDVFNDGNYLGPANWHFRLAWPTGATEEVGPYSVNDGDRVDFPDRSTSWLFSNEIEYWCEARVEGASFGREEWEGRKVISNPWDLATNRWHDRPMERGSTIYYNKFYIENKRPEVSPISGPSEGYKGVAYSWTTSGSDPEGDSLGWYYWYVDEDLKQAGPSSSFTYAFPANTSYEDHIIMVRVKDCLGSFSNYKYKIFTINPNPATQSILTVNTVGSGSVNLNPAGGVYDDGTVVQLTANSDSGWMFSGWSGDLTGSNNPESITVNEDKTVTATFTEIPGAIIPPPVTRVSDWPTFHKDLQRSGFTSAAATDTNSILWTFPTGNPIGGSPVVAAGRLYFSTSRNNEKNATIFCLNATTGAHLWNYTEGNNMNSPTVTGDRVYLTGGAHGPYEFNSLFCFDASTGALIWRYDAEAFLASAAPAVAHGGVYFGDGYGNGIYCLDPNTGTLRWRRAYARAGIDTGCDFDFSTPAVVEERIYIGSENDNKLYCIDAFDGTPLWNFTTGGTIQSSPAIVEGRVYFGCRDAKVYSVDAETGTHIWNYTTGGLIWSSPAVAHDRVYIGSMGNDNRVYCLKASTGEFLWSYPTYGNVLSSPAVADTRVYVGSHDNNFYCLDAETGTLVWKYKTGDLVFSSPAIVDGTVYVGSNDGTLYAFGGDTTKPPEIPGVDITDPEVPKILVNPLTLDFGGKPVDYPPKFDDIIIENMGDDPLILQSITLTEDGGGAFKVEEIYREGRLGALFPIEESLPFVLDPGKLLYVLVQFDDVDEMADPFNGILEIRSNDPDNPVVQVSLSGSGKTASGATTLDYGDVFTSSDSGDEGRWVLPLEVHDDSVITEAYVVDFFNLIDYDLDLNEDAKGITITGMLDRPDLPGRMLLEVWSKSSPEKLTVYNILISPTEVEGDKDTPSLQIEIVILVVVAILAVIGIVVYRLFRNRK